MTMNMNRLTLKSLCCIFFALLAGVTGASAAGSRVAGDRFEMNINISGTVVANGACMFVKTGDTSVNFGDIRFNTVNGTTSLETPHTAPLLQNTTLLCSGDTEGELRMKLQSTQGNDYVTDNNVVLLPVYNATLAKKYPSLGIRLSANGEVKNCGEWFDVDPNNFPDLWVSLIQIGNGSDLQNDSIISTASLIMAFN